MSLFDSIISGASEKFGLGNKGGTILSALLSLMTDQNRGGFAGFLDLFSKAGLGDVAKSWISSGANTELSDSQVTSVIGNDAISEIAKQAGVSDSIATSALGYMIPNVVDKLTPDGVVPDEKDLLTKIGDFLSGIGGAVAGAALAGAGAVGAVASGAVDKVGNVAGAAADVVGDAAGATVDAGKAVVGKGVEVVGDAAGATVDAGKKVVGAVGDTVGGALNSVGNVFDGDGDSGGGILKWLLPLILLGLLLLLGFWFCSKAPVVPVSNVNSNANANKVTNANANLSSNANGANVSNVNTAVDAQRTLGEVSLPNGTKLQAYSGGIEDQIVKFIQSDEYKNGTAESMKSKWFNFDDLNFVFGKTELDAKSKRQLDNIVAILKAFPEVKIKIGGYTDKKGDDAANLKLSDDRAKAVKAKLAEAGVGAQAPEAEGYGEKEAKVAETATDQERAVDRKTAVRLVKGDAGGKVSDASTKPAEANANSAKPATANTNK